MNQISPVLKDEPHSGFFRGFFSPYYFLASYFHKETAEEKKNNECDISNLLKRLSDICPQETRIHYHKKRLFLAIDVNDRTAAKYSLFAISSTLNSNIEYANIIPRFKIIQQDILDYLNDYSHVTYFKHDTHLQAIEETLVFQSSLIQEKISKEKILENEKTN